MNHRQLILFYVLMILYISNKLIALSGFFIPWFSEYFNDLICLPIMLTMALLLMQKINGSNYTITKAKMLVTWLLLSVWNEGLLPLVSKRFTADITDVMCYAAGLFIFAAFMNRKNYIS